MGPASGTWWLWWGCPPTHTQIQKVLLICWPLEGSKWRGVALSVARSFTHKLIFPRGFIQNTLTGHLIFCVFFLKCSFKTIYCSHIHPQLTLYKLYIIISIIMEITTPLPAFCLPLSRCIIFYKLLNISLFLSFQMLKWVSWQYSPPRVIIKN